MFESQCKAAHANLLAGKCPWCGQVVVNGCAEPPESASSPLRQPSQVRFRLKFLLLLWRTVTIPIAIVATGIAFATTWSLMTALGVGLSILFTVTILMLVAASRVGLDGCSSVTITMIGIFLWHAVEHYVATETEAK